MIWMIEEEGKVFTTAIGGSIEESRIESKSQSFISIPSDSILVILVFDFNKRKYFS